MCDHSLCVWLLHKQLVNVSKGDSISWVNGLQYTDLNACEYNYVVGNNSERRNKSWRIVTLRERISSVKHTLSNAKSITSMHQFAMEVATTEKPVCESNFVFYLFSPVLCKFSIRIYFHWVRSLCRYLFHSTIQLRVNSQ